MNTQLTEAGKDNQCKLFYTDYLMLDKLNTLSGQTALLQYEDNRMRACIPFIFEHMWYTGIQMINKGTPKPIKLGNESSYVCVRNLHEMQEFENTFSFKFSSTFKSNSLEPLNLHEGLSTFRLLDYDKKVSDEEHNQSLDSIEEHLDLPPKEMAKRLIGSVVKLNIRFSSQDWVKEVVSIPFLIHEVAFRYKTMTMVGSHGLELQINGFEQFQVHKGYLSIKMSGENKGANHQILLSNLTYDTRSIRY